MKFCTKLFTLVDKKIFPKIITNSKEVVKEAYNAIYERKTKVVVFIAALMMFAEIGFGYYTNSMALLADGWHMASHTFALGLTWIAYVICRKYANGKKFSFNSDKLLSLAGLSSAIMLQVIAILMAIEALQRLLNPLTVKFGEAIIVAVLGLIVNLVSAFILHHDHDHGDQNIKAAYFHVIADALTSITAIIALLAGMFFNIYSLDAISGILSSVIITKWAMGLIKDSGKMLIDFKKLD